jgi:hypothetical protein
MSSGTFWAPSGIQDKRQNSKTKEKRGNNFFIAEALRWIRHGKEPKHLQDKDLFSLKKKKKRLSLQTGNPTAK